MACVASSLGVAMKQFDDASSQSVNARSANSSRPESEAARRARIERAIRNLQDMVRRYVPDEVSLVDELLAERRREAAMEQEESEGSGPGE